MGPRYRSVAVIGAGPSGIAALRALRDENVFDSIRVFERQESVGGSWNTTSSTDTPFESQACAGNHFDLASPEQRLARIPSRFPSYTPPCPEDATRLCTDLHHLLDSSLSSGVAPFTHTPFPSSSKSYKSDEINRPGSQIRSGQVVKQYLDDLAKKHRDLISFYTTVESVEKTEENRWRLTLHGHQPPAYRYCMHDYWWQEEFDAVVLASGQYCVPVLPSIPGLDDLATTHPFVFEHARAFRSAQNYMDQRVVVVDGSFSATDLVNDFLDLVDGPLYLSQADKSSRSLIYQTPNVEVKPTIKHIEPCSQDTVQVTFADGSEVRDVEKIIFATGHWLSFPFSDLHPTPPNKRLTGLYQHIFKIGDPSLAVLGRGIGTLRLRVYEYQAVAVARYFAGRGSELPAVKEQEQWETQQVQGGAPSLLFYDVQHQLKHYMDFLRRLAGPPAEGTSAYELPSFDGGGLKLRDAYWGGAAANQVSHDRTSAKL